VNEVSLKVRVPKAAELVANHLRRQIINSELTEGDTLPLEAVMMAQYDVSRPTLREAIRILEAEGLVSISRGLRGAQVHPPKVEMVARTLGVLLQARGIKLHDVYRARALIEPSAARVVAERKDPGDVAKLRARMAAERESLEDDSRFSLASNEFRRTLVDIAGVQTLGLIVDMLNEMLERHLLALYLSSTSHADRTVSRRKSVKAQEKLIDLIERGDADEADRFWRRHLTAVESEIAKLEQIEHTIDMTKL
jgi:GntR family transcriptional regulator, transcriptional repressor for pyruvate dehydrogenase complex